MNKVYTLNRYTPRWLLGAVLASLVFINSCVSTTIQSIQHVPDFHSDRIHKVLIVSIASTPEIRKQAEDEFVRQWKERSVEAVASYAVLPPGVTLDKAGVEPFAKANGFDSVLVNRLVSRKAIDRSVHVHEYGETASEDNQNMTNYFQAVVASPEYPIPYEVAVLTTNVYDVATEKKIWSAVSQTLVTGDVPKKIRPFTETILKKLYEIPSK